MSTIYRYTAQLVERMEFELPAGARILDVAPARAGANEIELWAVVDPDQPPERRTLITVGTGHSVPDDVGEHLATLPFQGGRFIFHVFEAVHS